MPKIKEVVGQFSWPKIRKYLSRSKIDVGVKYHQEFTVFT